MQQGRHILRQRVVTVLVMAVWGLMTVRIGAIQLFDHSDLQQRAQDQREVVVTLQGERGRVLDTAGVELAVNVESASYGIRPGLIANPDRTVSLLADAAGLSGAEVRRLVTSDRPFVWLARQTSPDVERRIDALGLDGIEKIPEWQRYYPLGPVAAQVIGYTDVDNRGIEGCELRLDDQLTGRNGRAIVFRDAKQRITPTFDDPIVASRPGSDVVLTIDWRIQQIAEEEVARAVEQWDAIAGSAIVLDAGTGDILAMANVPRFDPNAPASFPTETRRNRIVTDMIEPGSTFKIVTFAEALESGLITEETLINCENGKYSLAGHIINDTHELEVVPAAEVLIESSNIGSLKIGEMIGKKNFYQRARLLGFGEATGCEVPDESPGLLDNPRNWNGLTLSTMSFGQGVAVSPLQITMAYAAVANDGWLLRPRLVREVDAPDGTVEQTEPQVIRRAMTGDTAARLTELLCRVVEEGTGEAAAVSGMRIAGKTGTAQKVREGEKGYAPGLYVSSFIGFIADRDPKILCYVVVDSPKKGHYGSQVAAPVFRAIMSRLVNMGDSPWARLLANAHPDTLPPDVAVPDVQNKTVAEAIRVLDRLGLSAEVSGDSTDVVRQFPLAGAMLPAGSAVTIYSNVIVGGTNGVKVPDLRGKAVREAVQHLVQSNLNVKIEGSGIVTSQYPAAGMVVACGTECTIRCNRQ